MRAAIYSSLPLNALIQQAVSSFGAVQEISSAAAIDPFLPITSSQQKGHITYIKPIQNRQSLTLLWELPFNLSNDPTQSASLIAYTLKRGQKNSLYEKLKEEQWMNSLSIQMEDIGGKDHQFFEISIDLTEKGLKEIDHVLLRVHQALA